MQNKWKSKVLGNLYLIIKIWGKVLYGKKIMQNSGKIWDKLKKGKISRRKKQTEKKQKNIEGDLK